jgi:hypothetical protein
MLFFQDRTLANGSITAKLNGGLTQFLNGGVYFPTNNVEYTGGSSTSSAYTALVAWDISFIGNTYFSADSNGSHTALGLPLVGIME